MTPTIVVSMPAVIVLIAAVVVVPVILLPDIHLPGRSVVIFAVFVIRWLMDDRWTGWHNHPAIIFAVPGHIDIPVPVVFDEINRPATGTVGVAVFVPMFDMTGRHPKIDRRIPGSYRPNNNRFAVDQARRGIVADVDTAVKTRFSHTDRYSGFGLVQGQGKQDGHNGGCCHKKFHNVLTGSKTSINGVRDVCMSEYTDNTPIVCFGSPPFRNTGRKVITPHVSVPIKDRDGKYAYGHLLPFTLRL
jgi:hypothetical protein